MLSYSTMLPRQGRKTLSTEAKHRVQLLKRTAQPNGRGGVVHTYEATGPAIWAAVLPLRATQHHDYRSVGVDATHVIKLRGAVDVAESDRIGFKGRDFEVLYVEDMQERGVVKFCTCKERR